MQDHVGVEDVVAAPVEVGDTGKLAGATHLGHLLGVADEIMQRQLDADLAEHLHRSLVE